VSVPSWIFKTIVMLFIGKFSYAVDMSSPSIIAKGKSKQNSTSSATEAVVSVFHTYLNMTAFLALS
jgi:hypothetical protein